MNYFKKCKLNILILNYVFKWIENRLLLKFINLYNRY